jgi:hypothetical protein
VEADPASDAEPRRTPRWCLHEVQDDTGGLVILGVDHSYADFDGKQRARWLVHVNITVVEQNRNGHPTAGEAEIVWRVEDWILAALASQRAHHPMRATTHGYRELFFYVDDPKRADERLTELAETAQPREWEYRISEDPEWEAVQRWFMHDGDCEPAR